MAVQDFTLELMERLYQLLDCDYYVVFTSISEAHIHKPDGPFTVGRMRDGLYSVSNRFNDRADILSRSLFRYQRATRSLVPVL